MLDMRKFTNRAALALFLSTAFSVSAMAMGPSGAENEQEDDSAVARSQDPLALAQNQQKKASIAAGYKLVSNGRWKDYVSPEKLQQGIDRGHIALAKDGRHVTGQLKEELAERGELEEPVDEMFLPDAPGGESINAASASSPSSSATAAAQPGPDSLDKDAQLETETAEIAQKSLEDLQTEEQPIKARMIILLRQRVNQGNYLSPDDNTELENLTKQRSRITALRSHFLSLIRKP